MKKINTLIFMLISMNLFSQNELYVAPMIGPIINKSVERPMEFIGYTIEAGYLHKGQISAAIAYGSLDLWHHHMFLQGRTGWIFLKKKQASLGLTVGLGYEFGAKDFMSQGDLTLMYHLPKGFDFTIALSNAYIPKEGYVPLLGIGFCKTIAIKKFNHN